MSDALEDLIKNLAKLPGLGPRSARRAVLYLLKRKDALLIPLAESLDKVLKSVHVCAVCGNVDTANPCHICTSHNRDASTLCVVEDVADLWALERAGIYRGRYHVLGGTLSALDGKGPADLRIEQLIKRALNDNVAEVILAMNATVDGQTTAHYIHDQFLQGSAVKVSRLAHGVPVGGELDYLDEGTLAAALKSRKQL